MSSVSVATSHLFIDLATFSELEGFLYGSAEAITWFVASVQKSNWFSYIPIVLRQVGSTFDFNAKNAAASVNRSGDYVLSIWFRAQIPQIALLDPVSGGTLYNNSAIRWTHNLFHNLFEKISISFNELVVQEFDNFWMDFMFQFRVPGGKRMGYRNMIGDIAAMTNYVGKNKALGTGGYFSGIFPLWFGEDTGLALPVAALPFNDIKMNFNFRDWTSLVTIYPGTFSAGGTLTATTSYVQAVTVSTTGSLTGIGAPSLQDPATFAHYSVVHNDERVKMGDAPRDMLIHQVQSTQIMPFKDVTSRTSFDLRLSHGIVVICFAARNNSLYTFAKGANGGEYSNYTTVADVFSPGPAPVAPGIDPIAFATLLYENTARFAMGADYFSLIQPLYFSVSVPKDPGYHMWSYALKTWDPTKPSGSTNYSKLANVSIQYDMSPACQNASGLLAAPVDTAGNPILFPNSSGTLVAMNQTWEHICEVRNWNIGRVANGSFGHPTL
jgi:hypothetical protein